MMSRHFEPLRPNRFAGVDDKYEFTHGTNSVCVYDINTMDFVKEIPVGVEPDCHSTSMSNRWLYMACADGLWCIDQESLEVAKVVDTGHVYATNVMPDGDTMLLHDAFGGILVLKGIEDMDAIHIHKRLDALGTNTCRDTLGGKGHFIGGGRYYLCAAWNHGKLFTIDMEDYAVETFMDTQAELAMGDDLVVSRDKSKAYVACYHAQSWLAVVDISRREVIRMIPTGSGSCGLTMTNDERYVIASNDQDDSISVIDTGGLNRQDAKIAKGVRLDEVVATHSAREGFEKLGIRGYIQGISIGRNDEVYVYGCSGNGALVRFTDIASSGTWSISYPGGKLNVSIWSAETESLPHDPLTTPVVGASPDDGSRQGIVTLGFKVQ